MFHHASSAVFLYILPVCVAEDFRILSEQRSSGFFSSLQVVQEPGRHVSVRAIYHVEVLCICTASADLDGVFRHSIINLNQGLK